VGTESINRAIHKEEHKNSNQARKNILSVGPCEAIRVSESPNPVLWAGAGCPQPRFAPTWQVRLGACASMEHCAALVPGSCCSEPPLFNLYFSSILVAAWKSKIGGWDLMHTEIVQFNGGNNLSNTQY